MNGFVTKYDCRSNEDKCFYCPSTLGEKHHYECVCITKKVLIRAEIEYEVEVPKSWGQDDIEFKYNDSSWCSGNLIEDLRKLAQKDGCLCGKVRFTYIKDLIPDPNSK